MRADAGQAACIARMARSSLLDEMVMEENPPLQPFSWEKSNDGWCDYVKGHNPYNYFGIYDMVRMDTFWLDK